MERIRDKNDADERLEWIIVHGHAHIDEESAHGQAKEFEKVGHLLNETRPTIQNQRFLLLPWIGAAGFATWLMPCETPIL